LKEGIDGSGTTTQTLKIHDWIKSLSKYNDVLTTHEPWKSNEIRDRLLKDKDAYSNGLSMAELYVKDRKEHQDKIIIPNLEKEVIILCDRHALSTFAYQNVQRVSYDKILELHKKYNIFAPNTTIFLDVDLEIAKKRIYQRGEKPEKFEKDKSFTKELIKKYREISSKPNNYFGNIIKINGNQSIEKVTQDIKEKLSDLFK
jgi:dTMP kinase